MRYLRDCKTDEEKLQFLKEIVEEDLDPALKGAERDTGYRTAVVLIAAMIEVSNEERLTRLTGYPPEFIADIAFRARATGLWSGETLCYEHWFEGDYIRPVDIWCDVAVVAGILTRTLREDGKFIYRAVRTF